MEKESFLRVFKAKLSTLLCNIFLGFCFAFFVTLRFLEHASAENRLVNHGVRREAGETREPEIQY